MSKYARNRLRMASQHLVLRTDSRINKTCLLVHPVVDDGVDTGVGHGQPVEGEVDVADVGDLGDGGVVVGVDEVDVVWRPADHEDTHHHGEHLHYLPNRLIGEVVQSRRRPLLGPSPG